MSPTLLIAGGAVAVGIAIGATGAWTWQGRNIDALKLEAKDDRISRDRTIRQTLERNQATLAAATDNAARAAAAARRDYGVARDQLDSLRGESANAVRASTESHAACLGKVAAFAVVFDNCSRTAIDMAGNAQEWYVEAVKQHEAGK